MGTAPPLAPQVLLRLHNFALQNCRVRYGVLCEHLDAVFAAQPGDSSAAMKSMFLLEAAVRNYHEAMIR